MCRTFSCGPLWTFFPQRVHILSLECTIRLFSSESARWLLRPSPARLYSRLYDLSRRKFVHTQSSLRQGFPHCQRVRRFHQSAERLGPGEGVSATGDNPAVAHAEGLNLPRLSRLAKAVSRGWRLARATPERGEKKTFVRASSSSGGWPTVSARKRSKYTWEAFTSKPSFGRQKGCYPSRRTEA